MDLLMLMNATLAAPWLADVGLQQLRRDDLHARAAGWLRRSHVPEDYGRLRRLSPTPEPCACDRQQQEKYPEAASSTSPSRQRRYWERSESVAIAERDPLRPPRRVVYCGLFLQ
jgi:hypothetical protein